MLSIKQKKAIYAFTKHQLPILENEDSMFYHLNNLKKLGYQPQVVIDIGAYHGEWTLEANKIFSGATFLMIEA